MKSSVSSLPSPRSTQDLKPDFRKTEAILTASKTKEVQRFCGDVNYLATFLSKAAQAIEPKATLNGNGQRHKTGHLKS